jgi:hypothetical protein
MGRSCWTSSLEDNAQVSGLSRLLVNLTKK